MEPKEVESTNSESIPLSNGVSSRSSTFDDKKEHTKWQSFKDSFKRYEGYEEEEEVDLEKLDDIQKGNIRTAKSPLKR